jgi:ADP-dependent NAD(P)H-hydrate dehydratase / NAD(P)H-hydrate epimerase
MLKIVTTAQMRAIEAAADASGLTYAQLMQNAGRAAARRAQALLGDLDQPRVTVLVGKGNNGGDGLVAARLLAESGTVRCYLLAPRPDDPLVAAAEAAGAVMANAEDDQGYRVLRQMVSSADLLVDALFGIGIRLPLRGAAVKILQITGSILDERRAQQPQDRVINPTQPDYAVGKRHWPLVLAVDCPSGLDCDSGEVDPHTLPADESITFIAVKPGQITFPGARYVGQLTAATAGVPDDLPELQAISHHLADAEQVHKLLPERPVNSHKGTYGKLLIVGGSAAYRGAMGLAARAAYRIGAGLVSVSTPDAVVQSLAGEVQEATWLPEETSEFQATDYNAVLVGPGWGQSERTRRLLANLLTQDHLHDLVMDADGLNLLAEQPEWWQKLPPDTVITPHPGEMARLSGLSTGDVQAARAELALAKAAEWQVILVFKGAHTLIASPDGGMTALPFKTDALAKAGTGDVLAGMIAGLRTQGLSAYEAAVAGSYLHGLAGERATQKVGTTRSVLAGDVIDSVAAALQQVENRLFVET